MYRRGPEFPVAAPLAPTLTIALTALALGGCMGSISGPLGSTGGGGGGSATAGVPLLPARIRRLTDAEYDASVQALLGTSQTPSKAFPPDSRQGSFTLNDAQRVDPVLAKQLDVAAVALVGEARGNGTLARLAPCADPGGAGAGCATTFIQSFGARAYRRALTTDESAALLAVYHAAADGVVVRRRHRSGRARACSSRRASST